MAINPNENVKNPGVQTSNSDIFEVAKNTFKKIEEVIVKAPEEASKTIAHFQNELSNITGNINKFAGRLGNARLFQGVSAFFGDPKGEIKPKKTHREDSAPSYANTYESVEEIHMGINNNLKKISVVLVETHKSGKISQKQGEEAEEILIKTFDQVRESLNDPDQLRADGNLQGEKYTDEIISKKVDLLEPIEPTKVGIYEQHNKVGIYKGRLNSGEHSEIIYQQSGEPNVSDAFKRAGAYISIERIYSREEMLENGLYAQLVNLEASKSRLPDKEYKTRRESLLHELAEIKDQSTVKGPVFRTKNIEVIEDAIHLLGLDDSIGGMTNIAAEVRPDGGIYFINTRPGEKEQLLSIKPDGWITPYMPHQNVRIHASKMEEARKILFSGAEAEKIKGQ